MTKTNQLQLKHLKLKEFSSDTYIVPFIYDTEKSITLYCYCLQIESNAGKNNFYTGIEFVDIDYIRHNFCRISSLLFFKNSATEIEKLIPLISFRKLFFLVKSYKQSVAEIYSFEEMLAEK